MRTDDRALLASVMDVSADPGFFESEVRRADALSAVPLSDFGYEIGTEPETPVPSSLAEPLAATDVWAPPVYLRYAVDGPDTQSTLRPVSLIVARRGDDWKLVSDADLPQYNRHTWRGPWDFGPVVARTVRSAGGTSVVVGHPDNNALVDALAAELPASVEAVTDFWGARWPRTALVVVTDSTAEFVELAGSAAAAGDIAAITVSDAVPGDGSTPTGQRVVFGPAASDRLTTFTTRSVLRHELTHYAVRADTVDGSPLWALEGFADYSGYRGAEASFRELAPTLAGVVAMGGPPTVLPRNEDFAVGGTRSSLAYESSWSVFQYVAAQYGEQAVLDLYRRMSAGADASLNSATVELFGVAAATFVEQWGQWTAQQAA